MSADHKIIIDMDILMGNPEILRKFHECANLMIIASTPEQVQQGYDMLEIVDDCMAELKNRDDTG